MPAVMEGSDASRMRENRAKARDLTIPDIVNPKRREACEADDELWLRTYCGDVFYNPFTEHQKKIIRDCGEALLRGTKKCKAAPRGDGKSSVVKYLTLKYSLARQVRFPLFIAATASKAKKALNSIKHRLAGAVRIDQRNMICKPRLPIGEDYPVECSVAAWVDPWPSRARNVTANDRRSLHIEWGADFIILPTWEDVEPLGPILFALGITSDELQGCNLYDMRPDFVVLDDLDSRDSLAAEDGVIAGKIEEAIDKTVAGLGGQNRGLGQFMLCTITSRESAAYKYSDPKQKPSYSGERIRAIVQWPDECTATEGAVTLGPLAQTYIELRQYGQSTLDDDGEPIDVFGRKAHAHFVENLEAMEAGAVLSNPYNFQRDTLPDGTTTHVSAYQRCLDYIADFGMVSFLTEHQNDPPETSGIAPSGLSERMIQKQVNGVPKGIAPPGGWHLGSLKPPSTQGCVAITHTTDVGKTKGFNWVVRGWEPNGTGHTIDYGVMSVQGAKAGSNEGLERALHAAVMRRMEEFKDMNYGGGQIDKVLSTFDARWMPDPIYAAVAKFPKDVKAIIGIGKSAGAVQGTFRDVVQNTNNRRKCGTTGAYEELHEGPYGKLWVIHASADKWKNFEQERWLTAKDKPGCMFLFGEPSDSPDKFSHDERSHELYAESICSEYEVEIDGKRKFITRGKKNDYFDASWHGCCAAAMLGIRVLGVQPPSKLKPSERPSARDLAARSRA